jgi:trans-2-enoyl-CoA reductase
MIQCTDMEHIKLRTLFVARSQEEEKLVKVFLGGEKKQGWVDVIDEAKMRAADC